MTNRSVMAIFTGIAPLFTWLINFLIPGRNANVLATEARNKARIMTLVNRLASYVDQDFSITVEELVRKCYQLGQFQALWAIEGVGKDVAEWHMARDPRPSQVLNSLSLPPELDGAWLMLHAGAGMAFAKYHVDRMKTRSEAEIKAAAIGAVDLSRANSRPGYFGATIEALGLVSRFMGNAEYCGKVAQTLNEYAPDTVGYFWRGYGRGLYFHPVNFVPGFRRPSRAIEMAKSEAPDEKARENLLSGIAWALTVVNMSNPEVMELVLRNEGHYFCGSPGFFNGVVSSVVMRYDTSPHLDLIQNFMRHQPADPQLRELWNMKITGPMKIAIDTIHPALKKHQRLDEVFHYQSLPAFVASLEST